MGSVQVLDRYYLGITALVTLGYQLFFFIIAFTLQIDKLTDIAGTSNFIVLACLTLGFSEARNNARNLVVSLLMILWAARLGGYLLFRILRTHNDHRFDEMRKYILKFGTFWFLQFLWVWVVSLPITVLNSPAVAKHQNRQPAFGTGRDIAGIIIYAIGFVMEAVSDAQRYRFRQKHGNDGMPCNVGFFYWTRHPNYFGEIIMHFAIFMIAISAAPSVRGHTYAALYATILGPIWLTVLLLFISGLPLSERSGAKKRYEKNMHWEEYSNYLNSTSILIPFPPQLYRNMPVFLKRTIFLEFPMYVFDPAKHSNNESQEGEAIRHDTS